ncbi:MAG: chemotaxis protein CheW [Gemmatimonadaceae bacterium]
MSQFHDASAAGVPNHGTWECVTFRLADQWLGVPVLMVQEVLLSQRIARVPMAPAEVAGFLNLRGQIVTAVDLRARLGLPSAPSDLEPLNIVVRHEGELFSFLVDEVGDVLNVAAEAVERTPATLDARWRQACSGIIRRERGLLVVVNVTELLRLEGASV